MLYSTTQTVMRVDPVLYIVHIALRPDDLWNLASYPYYCKYTNPGDPTAFRHLDCHPWAIVDEHSNPNPGKGFNIVQSMVVVDDEDYKNCTEMIQGFNKDNEAKLYEWAARLKDWGAVSAGPIYNL